MPTARSSSSTSAARTTPTPCSNARSASSSSTTRSAFPSRRSRPPPATAAAIKACRDRLAATGVDLAAYNSTENAADIADLRVALGIDSWNVYGVSYGSKLALIVLRNHPQGIRSVVLDSVSPATNNIVETWWSAPASSFKAIFAACAAQPACAAAYPNLEADFTATVNRLDATPAITQVKDAVRRAGDGQRRRLRLRLHADHDERARRCLRRPEDDRRHGARRCRARSPPRTSRCGGRRSSSAWAASALAFDRVLRGARQSHDRGRRAGEGEGGASRIPGPGAADPAQAGTTLHRVPDLERRKGRPFGERPGS